MSYYRNNVQHLYAIPALVAALLGQGQGISLDKLRERVGLIYPYLQSELFLRPASKKPSTRCRSGSISSSGGSDSPRGRPLVCLLERNRQPAETRTAGGHYGSYPGALPAHPGGADSGRLRSGNQHRSGKSVTADGAATVGIEWSQCTGVFDKALFKNFLQTLKSRRAITVNEQHCLEFDDRILNIVLASDSVVPAQVLYSIMQVTGLREAEPESTPATEETAP